MNKQYFFAFDVGATNGCSVLGTLSNGKLEIEELSRFSNKMIRVHNRFYWDIFALYEELKSGLKKVSILNIPLNSIGIDTWGVDFVYLGEDGSFLNQPRAYRDPYTDGIPEEYFKIISKKEVYNLTGIQIMNFNTLFQLFAAQQEEYAAFKTAKSILFLPDALSYMLTGNQVCEYTIASTSQMLNPRTKQFEEKLFEALEISPSIMPPVVMPGDRIGYVEDAILTECSIDRTAVLAVAGHDTASAVAAVPADDENFAYLSSGTWSLMGIEVKEPIISDESYKMNFTNEGGVDGTTRFLKNITGMWLLEQCRKEWKEQGKSYSYPQIIKMSDAVEGFQSLIDPDHDSFANPEKMTEAIVAFCKDTNQKYPETDAEFIRCIFDSLALKYKHELNNLQKIAPFKIKKLHIIGGGSQNELLNQATADSIGLPVIAGPSEATAIGNIMIQAKGLGFVNSLQEMRSIIKNSIILDVYMPKDTQLWEKSYEKFIQIVNYANQKQKL